MIKIRLGVMEFTLNGHVWTGEHQSIAERLNRISAKRPFRYEASAEGSIAQYIVSKFEHMGAEIIYDSEADRQPKGPIKGIKF